MEVIGYIFAIIIGVLLGIMGGGGSILSVPTLVYSFGMSTTEATMVSLFVVGITSLVGAVDYFRKRLVDIKAVLYFGIPSVVGVVAVRRLFVPALPNVLFNISGFSVSKDKFMLVIFAVLMLISAYKMLIPAKGKVESKSSFPMLALVLRGLIVGGITGLIGAGGGFLVVPALVMFLRMEMKEAIGTSLFIIALNSLIGFGSSMGQVEINWSFLAVFSALAVIGVVIGTFFAAKIDSKKLKSIFGYFVLLMGSFIMVKEIFFV